MSLKFSRNPESDETGSYAKMAYHTWVLLALYNVEYTVLSVQRNTHLYWKDPFSLQRAAREDWRWRWWEHCWCCSSAPCCTCRSCWEMPPRESGYCCSQKTASLKGDKQELASFWVWWPSCITKTGTYYTRFGRPSGIKNMQAEFLCVL